MEKGFYEVCGYLPERIREPLLSCGEKIKDETAQIRIRVNRPIVLSGAFGTFKPTVFGLHIKPSREETESILSAITENSVYSFTEDIKNGFITLPGGHRAGVCGTAAAEGMSVCSVRDISSVSIRIASCIKGAAEEIYSKVVLKSSGSVLIAGPPGSGKTTILRDLCERLGDSVAIVDERFEIAAARKGEPMLIRGGADVLSGYPKARGIEIALRAFSPEYIICDEISPREFPEIKSALFCGVRVIASAHAGSVEDILRRGFMQEGMFSSAVLLRCGKIPGKIKNIIGECDENSRNYSGCDSNSFSGNIYERKAVGTA